MNVADRIQHLRKLKGISQEVLADKIGVSRQAVSKWESEQSIPDLDKIIIMSEFFDVTTDYILRGIESEKQVDEKKVNAIIFVTVASVFNFIGLIVASAIWYEEQMPMAVVAGLIFMAGGCMIFGIGYTSSTQNLIKAKRLFWTINIWFLAFIPLSVIYNMIFSRAIAPYPLLVQPLIALPFLALIYFTLCFGVIFFVQRRTMV